MKPLDFVVTPKGAFAIITETWDGGKAASIDFIGPSHGEKNAWWHEEGHGIPEFCVCVDPLPQLQLRVIGSLPRVLAMVMKHPFGHGEDDVNKFFPEEQP